MTEKVFKDFPQTWAALYEYAVFDPALKVATYILTSGSVFFAAVLHYLLTNIGYKLYPISYTVWGILAIIGWIVTEFIFQYLQTGFVEEEKEGIRDFLAETQL